MYLRKYILVFKKMKTKILFSCLEQCRLNLRYYSFAWNYAGQTWDIILLLGTMQVKLEILLYCLELYAGQTWDIILLPGTMQVKHEILFTCLEPCRSNLRYYSLAWKLEPCRYNMRYYSLAWNYAGQTWDIIILSGTMQVKLEILFSCLELYADQTWDIILLFGTMQVKLKILFSCLEQCRSNLRYYSLAWNNAGQTWN